MALLFGILYWSALGIWSLVVTYVVVFVFFPEKDIHDEHAHSLPASPTFARHRFQQLPGNAELTVNDIVAALQHLPKDTATAAEASEEHAAASPSEHEEEGTSEPEEGEAGSEEAPA